MSSRACSNHRTRTVGCEPCAALTAMYERRRRSKIADGTWLRSVDATEVQAHLACLAAAGASMASVAAVSNLSKRTVLGVKHRKWVLGSTAAALLAVKAEDCTPVLPSGMVPILGASRRVQGLSWLGWSMQAQADRLGCFLEQVSLIANQGRPSVTVDRDRAVRALFESLSATRGPSARSHSAAVRKGWAPPLAWDDIDDPDALPDFGGDVDPAVDEVAVWRALHGDQVRLTRAEKVHALQSGLARGERLSPLAARLRLSSSVAHGLLASVTA